MSAGDWPGLIRSATSRRAEPVKAVRVVKTELPGISRPIVVRCDDGGLYVAKTKRIGRTFVNDCVVGLLGRRIGAPVGEVRSIFLSGEFPELLDDIDDIAPGETHGCRWIADCEDRRSCAFFDQDSNRERFARLAMLYGWVFAGDHQFLYEKRPPHLVHSVDHGHFFPDFHAWTIDSLSTAPHPEPDPMITRGCALTREELRSAASTLNSATDDAIATAVAAPPGAWGIDNRERVAMAIFLARRRNQLLVEFALGAL